MATGKILRFDEIRGYCFIAPDAGGEDVFLHANALLAEKHQYQPGVPVEFDVIEGERGLKATAVRVLRHRPASASTSTGPSVAATASVGAATPAAVPGPAATAGAGIGPVAVKPMPSPTAQVGPPTPSTPHKPLPHPPASQLAANGSSAGAVTTAPAVVTPATVAAATGVLPSAQIAAQRSASGAERPGRDVLTPDTLGSELVELCLESVPSMTGEQITQLRRAVVVMARKHGWLNE